MRPRRVTTFSGLLALCATSCFEPREQFLGSFGGISDGGGNATPDSFEPSEPIPSEQIDLVDAGAVTFPEPMSTSIDGESGPCVSGIVSSSQVRFLTRRQYDRTIRDLLGVEQLAEHDNHPPSWLLAPDSDVEVTKLAWDGYQAAAQVIAEQVMTTPELRSRFVACDLAERDSCLRATVVTFGRRAFRRPLTETELEGFAQLLDAGVELPVEEAAQILLEAFLISPSFLVRAELNQEQASPSVFTLSSHEQAVRLSYLLWGTMPDAQLDAAADASALITSKGVLTEAERMLNDPKARDMVNDFVEQYLHLQPGGAWELAKDEGVFPEYTQAVRDAMVLETQQFFQRVVLTGGTFADLLRSRIAFVNADTAPLYGLSAADFGQELEVIELLDRPGFLTRVGFLSAHSLATRTSPIRRGAFITSMLGFMFAPSEAAVATPLPEPELGRADTIRKRVELQTADAACMACHQLINPPGFVLEAFDAIGRSQSTEEETGAAIDIAVDWVVDGETHSITSVADLMRILSQSSQARVEYARRWIAFAFELSDVDGNSCAVRELGWLLAQEGYTQLDLLASLTQSEQFLSRSQETP